jgi:hypothetical protein
MKTTPSPTTAGVLDVIHDIPAVRRRDGVVIERHHDAAAGDRVVELAVGLLLDVFDREIHRCGGVLLPDRPIAVPFSAVAGQTVCLV